MNAASPQPVTPVESHPLVPPGERIIVDAKPSVWYILIRGFPDALPGVVVLVVVWLLRGVAVATAGSVDRGLANLLDLWLGRAMVAALVYIVLRLVWAALDWFCRRYVMTDARLVALRG